MTSSAGSPIIAQKTLVFIPTYNERENVTPLYERLKSVSLDFDMLFLDDNSPDGTGALLDGIAGKDNRVKIVHRQGKEGIGSAHKAGIKYAYDNGYDILVSMDSDFTHDPSEIANFLELSKTFDVVVGSRYLMENSLPNWTLYRKIMTGLGHFLTKHFLAMPYDATGAYRLYRLDAVDRRIFDRVVSNSYSFFFESLYAIMVNGLRIGEVAIALPARTMGHSKMTFNDVMQSVGRLVKIYFRCKINTKFYKVGPPESKGK